MVRACSSQKSATVLHSDPKTSSDLLIRNRNKGFNLHAHSECKDLQRTALIYMYPLP